MVKSNKKKIAAIVPALDEEANVGKVLKVLLNSKVLDRVILVDDGSTDRTAEIGKKLGAEVVKLPKIGGSGKGNAMKAGLEKTDAEIIVFFDADLVGLSQKHISKLVKPMLEEDVGMCVGIRDRLLGLPRLIATLDPLMAIGGERAIKRGLFEKIPDKFLQGFAVEPSLNYYCRIKGSTVKYVVLDNLKVVTKEEKWGFFRGFVLRLKMMFEILKIRLMLPFYKNELI
ncbi:MAG: glycosyltransferase [Candidatus Staskawiczbacteria bacterium]|nr:glycosyltransferase [Candidatus Staskawiczbacteria bacterium]